MTLIFRVLYLSSLLIFTTTSNLSATAFQDRKCRVEQVPCCGGTNSDNPKSEQGFWLENDQEIIIDVTNAVIIFNNELPENISSASIIKKNTVIAGSTVLRLVFQNSYLTGVIQIATEKGIDYSHNLVMAGADINGEIAILSCQKY